MKLGPKHRWIKISHLEFFFFVFFFWIYYFSFGHTTFLYSSTRFSGHNQSFFKVFNLLAESLKANKNQRKSSLILQYSFAQRTSLILWTSINLTLKIIYFRNIAENLSLFKNFSVWCQKRHLHCTISVPET